MQKRLKIVERISGVVMSPSDFAEVMQGLAEIFGNKYSRQVGRKTVNHVRNGFHGQRKSLVVTGVAYYYVVQSLGRSASSRSC